MGHREDAASAEHKPAASRRTQDGPVILIIDDQRAMRLGVGRLLATAYPRPEIHHAVDGVQALDALERHAPDVVVLDVDLDGFDGLSLLPQLSDRARVLVLTSHADPATRARAFTLGASALVGKDEAATVLLERVATLLHSSQALPPRSWE